MITITGHKVELFNDQGALVEWHEINNKTMLAFLQKIAEIEGNKPTHYEARLDGIGEGRRLMKIEMIKRAQNYLK